MKSETVNSLSRYASLLRGNASRYAIIGVLIAVATIITATALVSLYETGSLTLHGVVRAQQTNPALWLLNLMPFLFAFWGQYVSSMMAYQASAMVIDETNELRTQTILLEKQAMHDITHDGLTGLPNRPLLMDRLSQAIHVAHNNSHNFAVLMMDIDRFKEINETLGHHQGDRVLRQFANRLMGIVQDTDTVARIGGDEFVIMLPKIATVSAAVGTANNIGIATKTPFALEGLALDVQASIGISFFPTHGPDPDTLLQRAEMAMYITKKEKSGYKVYDSTLDKQSPRKLTLTSELRQALDADELQLDYQPKVNLLDGAVQEVEALARWPHPRYGLVPPEEFIPLAERTGLIKPLTLWAMKKAVQQFKIWHTMETDVGIAINVSASDLHDSELVDRITGLLASSGVPPNRLTIEITETSIMINEQNVSRILKQMADMSVRVSIDDFGTGYSSLSHLSELPVNEIKIDRSFVMDMLENPKHLMIVRAIINLGHNMDLEVTAEGVPNQETLIRLQELGCDCAQGFYISKPLAPDTFPKWKSEYSLATLRSESNTDAHQGSKEQSLNIAKTL